MASKQEQRLKLQAKGGRRGGGGPKPRPLKVPGATEVTKRGPTKPRQRDPEPHPERKPRTEPPRKPTVQPDHPNQQALRQASDQRALEEQERLRPKPVVRGQSRAVFGHVHYDGVRVTVTLLCPWCAEQHMHRPGDPTHHTCEASGNRYSVMIPLQALEALQ